jgi:hypothetical protein
MLALACGLFGHSFELQLQFEIDHLVNQIVFATLIGQGIMAQIAIGLNHFGFQE